MAGVSPFPCRGSTRCRRLPVLSSDRPILIIGAGGFIGGRVVEMLQGLLGIPVRASVRRWSSAVRIGRLPVEIVLCDIADADQVRRAMDGVGGVVHCAYGDPAVFVQGTRTVLQAALEAGVDRVVHLSTMEVYGDVEGVVFEDPPLRKTGWSYRDAKIDAELACRSYRDRGLSVSILRPPLCTDPSVETGRPASPSGSWPEGPFQAAKTAKGRAISSTSTTWSRRSCWRSIGRKQRGQPSTSMERSASRGGST